MGIAYSSPRQTIDIDLTTTLETTSQSTIHSILIPPDPPKCQHHQIPKHR